jgi:hypothetical protein
VQLADYASLRPRAHEGQMKDGDMKKAMPREEEEEREKSKEKGKFKEPPAPQAEGGPAPDRVDISRGIVAAAQGEKQGAAFHYVLNRPLSLARQKSALLPIVNGDVQAERVSIYNATTLATNPLLGVRLKNTTGLHLMQGPVTVFDGSSYAGDALIRDLQPNEERLLSYAVDQAIEVKMEAEQAPETLVSVRIDKGILQRNVTFRETATYRIKSRADKERLLILEHPLRSPDWKLVTPAKEPAQTRSHYEFVVKVPANGSQSYPVVEERQALEQTALTNLNDETVALLLQSKAASAALKEALRKAADLKAKAAKTQAEITQLQARLKATVEDQVRQRENLKVIPQTDPGYRKYLDRFLAAEGQIETLRGESERLAAAAARQRQEYSAFIANLTVKE